MKNVLTIYRFDLPFIIDNNQNIKFDTIIEEIRRLLMYDDILISFDKKIIDKNIFITFKFKDSYINIILDKNPAKDIFIPIFYLELFSEIKLEKNFLEDFCSIFFSNDYKNYIFDFISDNIKITNSKLIYLKDLKNDFKYYDYEKLNIILKNTSWEYLDTKIVENIKIRNSFLYMIYICFNIYKNILQSKNWIKQLEEINWKITDNIYSWQLELFEKRLEMLKESNIIVFEKYKILLEKMFYLISWK